jgi:hypothetical protein
VECAADQDCDDQIECTVDSCTEGFCDYLDKCACHENADCDDANACTVDQCIDNACSYNIVSCPGGRECNPQSGCEIP